MKTSTNKRLLIAWLVASAITVVYLIMDHTVDDAGVPKANTLVTTSAVVLALVKVRIIFREFMEVRNAPALLSRITDLWLVLFAVGLLGSYFIGRAIH